MGLPPALRNPKSPQFEGFSPGLALDSVQRAPQSSIALSATPKTLRRWELSRQEAPFDQKGPKSWFPPKNDAQKSLRWVKPHELNGTGLRTPNVLNGTRSREQRVTDPGGWRGRDTAETAKKPKKQEFPLNPPQKGPSHGHRVPICA